MTASFGFVCYPFGGARFPTKEVGRICGPAEDGMSMSMNHVEREIYSLIKIRFLFFIFGF